MYAEEIAEHFMELGSRVDEMSFAQVFAEKVVPTLETAFADNFARASTADGQPWPPRKDPRPKHPLLVLSGALKQSVTAAGSGVTRIGNREIERGTSLPYAATHQFGDGSRNIAARPYLDAGDEFLGQCETAIADAFEEYVFG